MRAQELLGCAGVENASPWRRLETPRSRACPLSSFIAASFPGRIIILAVRRDTDPLSSLLARPPG